MDIKRSRITGVITTVIFLTFGTIGCQIELQPLPSTIEEELEIDPNAADSDGDGFTDQEELDCVSDPFDASEVCYACGWEHNDPGTIEGTGNEVGDVMASVTLLDQCGDEVDLWDFYGEYHVLYMTAAW